MVSNKQWLTDVNLAFTNGYNKALEDLVQKLAEIDPCEFASFTLCLVREKADELKKGATNENNNRDTERV